jgi:hypothetical protein
VIETEQARITRRAPRSAVQSLAGLLWDDEAGIADLVHGLYPTSGTAPSASTTSCAHPDHGLRDPGGRGPRHNRVSAAPGTPTPRHRKTSPSPAGTSTFGYEFPSISGPTTTTTPTRPGAPAASRPAKNICVHSEPPSALRRGGLRSTRRPCYSLYSRRDRDNFVSLLSRLCYRLRIDRGWVSFSRPGPGRTRCTPAHRTCRHRPDI